MSSFKVENLSNIWWNIVILRNPLGTGSREKTPTDPKIHGHSVPCAECLGLVFYARLLICCQRSVDSLACKVTAMKVVVTLCFYGIKAGEAGSLHVFHAGPVFCWVFAPRLAEPRDVGLTGMGGQLYRKCPLGPGAGAGEHSLLTPLVSCRRCWRSPRPWCAAT